MSTVDRRPTVVRNLLGGDRRSIEATLEHWMAARPAVTHITLDGDGPSVAATALGLRDLALLRGGALPCGVVARVPPSPAPCAGPVDALAQATGAGVTSLRDVGPGDVLLLIHPHTLGAKMLARVARLSCARVLVLPLDCGVPRPLRRGGVAIPTVVDSLVLSPLVEAAVEDLTPSRLLVAGGGPALFGAVISAGDFFLERQRSVPGAEDVAALLRQRVLLLEDALVPGPWKGPADVWRQTCERAGATVEATSSPDRPGLVMTPHQRQARAA